MILSNKDASASTEFVDIISRDGWTVAQVGACLRRFAEQARAGDEQVCRALLAWLDAVQHAGEHATGRRFTRLQLIENSLSHAGFSLTARDFSPWFDVLGQDWRPDELLPYAPQDMRLIDCEARVAQLEHELHQMQVSVNRARAEVNYVVAERKHYLAVVTQEIHQLVGQDYENSASWRVTKPLRRAMSWSRAMRELLRGLFSRHLKAVQPAEQVGPTDQAISVLHLPQAAASISKPKWASLVAPWDQPGYSIEAAWRRQADADFDRNDYAEWVRRYDTLTAAELADMRRQIVGWPYQPKISLLMHVGKADGVFLDQIMALIHSVQMQVYPHWTLLIAVAADANPAINAMLDQVADQDARIKRVDGVNGGYEHGATVGEWFVLLGATDLIASHALYMVAESIRKNPDWQIIYSDSDKLVGPKFQRSQPYLKPDWDVDLFFAQNYTEHLCAFDAKLVRQVGWGDGWCAVVATFELTLRCLAYLGLDKLSDNAAKRIGHIPHVLYHAGTLHEQDTRLQRLDVLTAHFARFDTAARATVVDQGLRIQYPLPEVLPMVSLIIPTKNNVKLLRQCLDSVLNKTTYPNYEVLVVDNGSDQSETLDYLKLLAADPRIRVIRDNYVFNYSALNNAAVQEARGEIVGLVNDDIEVKAADWLSEMVAHVLRSGVGAVGARLWYPDLTLQHAGMVMVGGIARHVHKHLPAVETGFSDRAVLVQSFTAVTGACLLVKKALYEQLGGLNERELAIGFNDVDFCMRLAEAGYHNVWTPYAELFHHESATRGQDDSPEKQRRAENELRYMRRRWGDRLLVDPAYNPNLTDGHDDLSLAWPPRCRLFAA
jgi:GT2 family glycosyltransferase